MTAPHAAPCPHCDASSPLPRGKGTGLREKVYRPREGRLVAGVCAGAGHALGVNPTWVRLVFALGVLATGGMVLWAYAILWALTSSGEGDEAPVHRFFEGVRRMFATPASVQSVPNAQSAQAPSGQ